MSPPKRHGKQVFAFPSPVPIGTESPEPGSDLIFGGIRGTITVVFYRLLREIRDRKGQIMKKINFLLLALLFVFTAAVSAQDEFEEMEPTHLTVGSTTPMHGKFFTDLWEDVTSDGDVRALIHAYNLVMWDPENGRYVHDPSVVNNIGIRENDYGDRSYMITLQDDLAYSDGTKITAWDYAFSYLLSIAPEINELGGHAANKQFLFGYQQYHDGELSYLPGVQVIADDQLMITLDHEFLPFFYEEGLISCNPYPIDVIAPGTVVRDDGFGVYLTNEDSSVKEPVFNAELLRQTILDPESGYQTHPSVVSGPYRLTSWDGVTAEFEINPYYKGNHDGKLPLIQTISYTLAENDSMAERLASGELDLLNKVTKSETVQKALPLIQAGYQMANYPRTGIAFISFNGENPALQSQMVRRALAWCMDRDEVIGAYTGYYGLRVDSYYGLGQWMYSVVNGSMAAPVDPPENENDYAAQRAYERELEEWENLSLDDLTVYELNLTTANLLLDNDGWVMNDAGVREKEIDGKTVRLSFRLLFPEGNNIDEVLEELWVPNLRECGIELTMEEVPMMELMRRYLSDDAWNADMVYIARNFEGIFDPSAYFRVGEQDGKETYSWFTTNIGSEKLYKSTVDMRRTEPGAVLDYVKKWIKFAELFNEELPMIPIYSNVYFDFFTPLLQEYYISQNESWGQAVVGAYLGDKIEEDFVLGEDEEFEEFEDFGGFEFMDDEDGGGEFFFIDDEF